VKRFWIGTSGWNYRHWRGVFYPEGVAQRRWLEHYATHFDTVELNATFYGLPSATTAAAWAARVPGGFRFSVKASRYMTHLKRLQEPEAGWGRLVAACEPLGSKLSVYLVQLPPRFRPDPERLDRFLGAAPAHVPVAVEFRDVRWFVPEVEDVLRAHGAALAWSDFPGVPSPEWVTSRFLYLRRHGATGRYVGRYGAAGLRALAKRLERFDGDVFCYFNNDTAGAAVDDAHTLRRLLQHTAAHQPRPAKEDPPRWGGWPAEPGTR
jgi:uncharacterized protein YecE (DUF72 family)